MGRGTPRESDYEGHCDLITGFHRTGEIETPLLKGAQRSSTYPEPSSEIRY